MIYASGLNHLEQIKGTLNYSYKIRIYFICITATASCGIYLEVLRWTSLDDRHLNFSNAPVTEIRKEKPLLRACMPVCHQNLIPFYGNTYCNLANKTGMYVLEFICKNKKTAGLTADTQKLISNTND